METSVKQRKKAATKPSGQENGATHLPDIKVKPTSYRWRTLALIVLFGVMLAAYLVPTFSPSSLDRILKSALARDSEQVQPLVEQQNAPAAKEKVKTEKKSKKKKKGKKKSQKTDEEKKLDEDLAEVQRSVDEATPSEIENRNLKVEEGENEEITSIMKCSNSYAGPAPGRKQRCCELKPGKLSCLPNLIVVGAQKSGTTAVHSYLLLHPQIIAARKKEMHMFDFDKSFKLLRTKLTETLPELEPQLITQRISIDSTPSYIADHKACPRMAKILSKDARFVLMLREPGDRIWSELQMKNRRVLVQDEFLNEILPTYHQQFAKCLKKCPPKCEYDPVRKCLPTEIQDHGRLGVFIKFINDAAKAGRNFTTECFDSPESTKACLDGPYKDEIMKEKMPPLPDEIYWEIGELEKHLARCCLNNATVGTLKRQDGFRENNKAQKTGTTGKAIDAYDTPVLEKDDSDPFGFCEGCGCRCFPRASMMSDISKFHVWRSMYYPQLVHCLATIDRSRILIENMQELVDNPQVVMSRIFKHAGLRDLDLSQFSREQVQALFRRHYPDFETVSGWAHSNLTDNMPTKMPEDVRERVNDFLRPLNRKLFDLLGVKPWDGWAA